MQAGCSVATVWYSPASLPAVCADLVTRGWCKALGSHSICDIALSGSENARQDHLSIGYQASAAGEPGGIPSQH